MFSMDGSAEWASSKYSSARRYCLRLKASRPRSWFCWALLAAAFLLPGFFSAFFSGGLGAASDRRAPSGSLPWA